MNIMAGTMLNCSQLILMMCHCLYCSNVHNLYTHTHTHHISHSTHTTAFIVAILYIFNI